MSSPTVDHDRPQPKSQSFLKDKLSSSSRTVFHHLKKHVGVGIICSVAYFDPGNWSVDLQAGSSFGYRPMLFVILMAGLGAIVLQILACKLGCITGLDLASHCRLLLHQHPRHPRLLRRLVLYPLYLLSEIAIISTDLAELLGSAIGLVLLFPRLPLWAGVAITAADVLIFLSFSDPSGGRGRPVRAFELTIIALVFAVFGCFIALLVKASPDWSHVFMGYVPDRALFQSNPDAVYAAVGILGATVMPHALFLGSSMSTQDRISDKLIENTELPAPTPGSTSLKSKFRQFVKPLFKIQRAERVTSDIDYRSRYGERENNKLAFIQQHLWHGIVDVVTSLIAIAVPINSAILILAAAVFFKNADQNHDTPAGLFDAHELIKLRLGSAAATIFALALVCAGQTSSITVTLAGQIVSEGFIEWKVSPFLRRLITRCISLVPSVVVAVAVGREGISKLLVISQVILSVVLPFVAFPLIYLTSSSVVMAVRRPQPDLVELETAPQELPNLELVNVVITEVNEKGPDIEQEMAVVVKADIIDFSNGRLLMAFSYAIWAVVVLANAYAIVTLFIMN